MNTAVVTGIGVTAPTGLGTDAYWAATTAGSTAIRPVDRFDAGSYPARLAGVITDFDERALLPGRLIPQTDRITQFALVATQWALTDAGLDPSAHSDFDLGVVTAASAGGFEYGQRELQKLYTEGPQAVSAYMSFSWFYAVNTGQLSIRHGLRGPAAAVVTDGAGGLDALGHARRQIRQGTPAVLSGGMGGMSGGRPGAGAAGLAGRSAAGASSSSARSTRASRTIRRPACVRRSHRRRCSGRTM